MMLILFFSFRNLLLSTRGIDLSHLSQKLERITARRSLQPLDPTPVTNINSFLKNELENSILGIVEHTSETVRILLLTVDIKFYLMLWWTYKPFQFETAYQKRAYKEMKKVAQMRTSEFLNSLHGLAELDPETALARKVGETWHTNCE